MEDEGQDFLCNDFIFKLVENATNKFGSGTEFHVTINGKEIPILIAFFEEQYLSSENTTLENAVIPLAQSEIQVDEKFHKNMHIKDFIVLIKNHHTEAEYSITILINL